MCKNNNLTDHFRSQLLFNLFRDTNDLTICQDHVLHVILLFFFIRSSLLSGSRTTWRERSGEALEGTTSPRPSLCGTFRVFFTSWALPRWPVEPSSCWSCSHTAAKPRNQHFCVTDLRTVGHVADSDPTEFFFFFILQLKTRFKVYEAIKIEQSTCNVGQMNLGFRLIGCYSIVCLNPRTSCNSSVFNNTRQQAQEGHQNQLPFTLLVPCLLRYITTRHVILKNKKEIKEKEPKDVYMQFISIHNIVRCPDTQFPLEDVTVKVTQQHRRADCSRLYQ